ncbi:MAG: hypothetical protein J6B71_04920 [Clostridia bacterium]|nr:hypothetical protein [Clostridia bacterium]
MKMQKIRLPELSRHYRAAGETLSRDGNRLLLIEAILLLLLNLPMYLSLDVVMRAVFSMLSPPLSEELALVLYLAPMLLLALLFTLPSLIGVFVLAGRLAYGASPTLSELFAPFSSWQSYARTMHLAWGAFWRFGLTALAAVLIHAAGSFLLEEVPLGKLAVGFAVALVILLGLLLCLRAFPTMAVVLFSQMPVKEARKLSRQIAKCARGAGLRFVLGFLGWILLGLLTLGVLLLWDTLPRMLIAYFDYLKQIYEMIIHSED